MTSYIVILEGLELSYAVQKYPFEKIPPKKKVLCCLWPLFDPVSLKNPSYVFVLTLFLCVFFWGKKIRLYSWRFSSSWSGPTEDPGSRHASNRCRSVAGSVDKKCSSFNPGKPMANLQQNYNTPVEHTPGNPPSPLWKESLCSLLVKV